MTIGLSSSDTGEGTVLPVSLTFTNANWNVAQTVTVTGVNDSEVDGTIVYTIITAAASSTDLVYNGMNPADVSVTNTDNDVAGITVTPTTGLITTEPGGTTTFTVVLTSQPTRECNHRAEQLRSPPKGRSRRPAWSLPPPTGTCPNGDHHRRGRPGG